MLLHLPGPNLLRFQAHRLSRPDGTISTVGPRTIMATRSRPFRPVVAPFCELSLPMMCGPFALRCGRCVPARSAPVRLTQIRAAILRGQFSSGSHPQARRLRRQRHLPIGANIVRNERSKTLRSTAECASCSTTPQPRCFRLGKIEGAVHAPRYIPA